MSNKVFKKIDDLISVYKTKIIETNQAMNDRTDLMGVYEEIGYEIHKKDYHDILNHLIQLKADLQEYL